MKRIITIIFLLLTSYNASAEAFVLYDVNSHTVVHSTNQDQQRSIASLTKLMTAMVYIDSGDYDVNTLELLLIRSDNKSAERIAKSYKGGYAGFINDMNKKAGSLGLQDTVFFDSSGLSVFNRSTAREYIEVVLEAEKYPLIKQISATYEKKIQVGKRKSHLLRNTNSLLKDHREIVLSKTGFTNIAGRCLALFLERNDSRYAIVILGERSPENRSKTAKKLINMIN